VGGFGELAVNAHKAKGGPMEKGPVDPRYVLELEEKLRRYEEALFRIRYLAHLVGRLKKDDSCF
jgi:hypothetical protein